MNPNLKRFLNRTVAAYVLAGLVLLAAFAYLRFPGEAVTDYIEALAAAGSGDTLLTIDAVRPSFPPGLAVENVTVGFRPHPEAALHADRLVFRPGWLSLLRGRMAMAAVAEGYGGTARGTLEYAQAFSLQGPLTAEAAFQGLRVDKCAWLQHVLGRQVTGQLKGSLAFNGVAGALKGGTGNLDFTLANGTYGLQENFFGFERFDFSRVDGKIGYRNGGLRINQLTLSGEKIRLALKGNVLLAEPLEDSQLDITGTIDIPVQGNKRVTMAIGGTLGNPKTRFQ